MTAWDADHLLAVLYSLTATISVRALQRACNSETGAVAQSLALLSREKSYIEEMMEKPSPTARKMITAHLEEKR